MTQPGSTSAGSQEPPSAALGASDGFRWTDESPAESQAMGRPRQKGPPAIRALAWIGLSGLALFATAFAVLHAINWEAMTTQGRHVSNLAHMPGGWFWDFGLVGLGVGTWLLAAGLRRALAVAGPASWALTGLQLAAACIVLMVPFPTDRNVNPDAATTLTGYLHDTFAVSATFLITWSMLLMVAAARVDPAWRDLPGRSWGWPVATIALAMAWMLGDISPYWQAGAFVQRAVVLLMALWLARLGWRTLALQAHAPGTPQPAPPPQPTR